MFFDTQRLIDEHRFILNILNIHNIDEAKLVGGCVRDFLKTGQISEDIDISTVLTPNEVKDILYECKNNQKINNNFKFIVLDKDEKYGTIVVIIEDLNTKQKNKYEITTTRSDISCFGRKANVEFCKSFEIDSQRRDFTINALYLGLSGEICDFHNGINDLKDCNIVFIGDPDNRIKEDYLRIIRLFRFATKFNNFSFCKNELDIIKQNKDGLLKLSKERIKSEIYKMLSYDHWFNGLKSLHDNGLIQNIFNIKDYSIKINPQNIQTKENLVKLFYFFNYDVIAFIALKENLRFTKEEKRMCDFIVDLWKKTSNGKLLDIEAKIFIYKNTKQVLRIIDIFHQTFKNKIEEYIETIKPIPVNVEDIINLGFKDKEIGLKVNDVIIKWIKSNFTATKQELLK